MKHLDEGTLQAWLDMPRSGLDASEVADIERHLGSCPACAAALDALRGSDDSVHALLAGGLDRDIARPPFEDVLARAQGRREARRGLGRLSRMAWAASIVVALGVGWMTNELYRSGPPSPMLRAPVPATERALEDAEEVRASAELGEANAPVPAESPGPSERAAAGTVAEADPTGADDVAGVSPVPTAERTRQQAAAADALADAPAPAAPPSQANVDESRVGRAASPDALAGGVAAPDVSDGFAVVRGVVRDADGEPVPSAQVYVEELGTGALSRQDGAYTLVLPRRLSDTTSLDVVVQRIGFGTARQEITASAGGVAVADFRLEEEVLQLQEVVVTGTAGGTQRRAVGNAVETLEAVSFSWEPDTREAVEADLGGPLLTVPGYDVLSVESAAGVYPGGGRIARVRQELGGDGVVLTLVQGPGEGGRDAWPIASEGALGSRSVGGFLVTGTGPMSMESLRALLDSLQ